MTSIIPGRMATYRKRLTNPGQRSTIPDAYLQKLNPALFARRQANTANAKRTQVNNDLYDPMKQLSGSGIYSLAKNLAGLEYDPQIKNATTELALARANDTALSSRIAGYNQMASSALATAHEQAQTGASQLASQLASTRTGLSDQMNADEAKSQQMVTQDSQLRGSEYSAGMGARLAQDFQQQRAGVMANQAAQENAGNVGASGFAGLMTMMQGAQAMRGADQLAQINNASANREAGLQSDITSIVGKKGAAQVDNIEKLRQSEFEKAAAVQTLNIKGEAAQTATAKAAFDQKYKVAKLKADQAYRQSSNDLRKLQIQYSHGDRSAALLARIRQAQETNKTAAKRLDIAQGNLDVARQRANQAGSKLPKADEVKGKWLPPVAMAHAVSDFHRLQGDPALRKLKADGKSRQEAADAIMTSDKWGKLDPSLISAALDIVYNGHISPGTASRLHRSKIQVSGLGVPVRQPSGGGVVLRGRKPSSGPAGGDPAGRYK